MPLTTTHKKSKINITDLITEIIHEITIHSNTFSHIDANKLLVCLGSNRADGRGGIYGKLVPLKFKYGSDMLKFRGKCYTIPRIINNNIPMLYAVYFYAPKFFDLSAAEKLETVFHELYHISPEFNGDIRRMGNIKKAHGFSKKKYESNFKKEANLFYEYIINTEYIEFLKMDSRALHERYIIYARRMKVPKPILIDN